MSIPGSVSPLFFGAGAGEAAGFQIDRSLRFTSGDSASLTRTPSSAGNRKTWTWSCWVKRSALGTRQMIFGNITSSGNGPGLNVEFQADDKIQIVDYNSGYDTRRITTQKFVDPASFYHIVVVYDTTNATAGDRIRLYVNGARITDLSSVTNPSQNFDGYFNTAQQHAIGTSGALGSLYLSAYIAEVNFVDGTALDESDFGEYDSNNVWQAKDTSGLTFGTNGFRLKFDDNSSNAALGNDSSGNDNDWTVNNLTAAATDNNWADYVYASDSTYDSTATGTNFFTGAGSQENLFDGSTSTQVGSVNANMAWVYFRPANAITGVTSLRIWGSYNSTTKINGTDYQESPAWSSTPQWVSVPSPPSSITEIAIQGSAARISAIEVNGSVLVDPTPASAIDSLIDTPTNYSVSSGNAGGNYATLTPLHALSSNSSFADGNLEATVYGSSSRTRQAFSTINPSSGKFYFEVTPTTVNTTMVGLFSPVSDSNVGTSRLAIYRSDRYIFKDGSNVGQVASTYAANDVIGVAYDIGGSTVKFYKNGTLDYTISSFTKSLARAIPGFGCDSSTTSNFTTAVVNFGQRPFAYTPPSGHLSICTQNLSLPTIADGSTAFDAVLWTGNGSSAQTISTPNLSPGMVWFKERSSTSSNAIVDAVRGSTNAAKVIYPDRTDAEITANSTQSITSLNSDGFTIGSSDNSINQSSQTYVGWAWDAGTVANPVGDVWEGSATKYIGVKFASASGGTVVYGQTSGSTTVEVWTSSNNSTWTQQGYTLTLSDGHTLTTSDQYVVIRNTSDATFTNWYAAATNGADGHYSSVTYPSGASWSGPAYTDFDWRDEGGVVNTDGSITSSVRANQTAGFSIVSYTGNSTAGSTIGHGLNAQPGLVIIKNRDRSINWVVGHLEADTFKTGRIYLNTNGAQGTDEDFFNDTNPTSSVFTVKNNYEVNYANEEYLALVWAPVEGFSQFGTYQGLGGSEGPFVPLSFKPAWLMVKGTSTSGGSWVIYDNARGTYNLNNAKLAANLNGEENNSTLGGTSLGMDFLSNGFKYRGDGGDNHNGSGYTYLYAAFSQHPMSLNGGLAR